MAPNNNNNRSNSDQPKVLGAVSKGSTRFYPRAASLPDQRGQSLVTEQSSVAKKSKVSVRRAIILPGTSIRPQRCPENIDTIRFPFPISSERIDTLEEGINKRLDKLESFAINTNVRAKNAREVLDNDTVVLHLRGLAQVILFEAQSLNQATLAQIVAEVQATNARMALKATTRRCHHVALREEGISLAHIGIENHVNPLKEQIADLKGRLIVTEASIGSLKEQLIKANKATNNASKEVTKLKEELGLNQVKLDICIEWITKEDKEKTKKKDKKDKKKAQKRAQPEEEAQEQKQ
ncbi:hypothetical protein FMEXI_2034 [Fusarium mexicanum]|uniref:Uncharacterized protein n=1 Tax=Fusarium mexicanum TaxID=751941 RepID=A0A8H5N6F7_9HYPO|nr:hypothetical protein FMEXI_2034 [Fusarium mexicanum]